MGLTQLKTGAIADDAVTTDKLANAINTERTANTAKSTNATHSGEVTGSGALTITADAVTGAKIADDAVGAEHIEQLDANIDFADDAKAVFGASSDLQIFHNAGGNSQLKYANGNLAIKQGSHSDAQALQFDGNGHLYVPDNEKIYFGAGADLQIYHDGTDSYVANTTGSLYILPKSGENGIQLVPNGTVKLYYDNTAKFETTSAGATVTGEIEISSGHLRGDSTNGLRMFSDSTASTGITLTTDDDLVPQTNNAQDLGTSSLRWRNIYTNDLNLSNEGSSNDVDGTWGSYTIQEGAEDLFLVNKRNGKKYKFNLTEVS